jgi:hydrogenase maturation protein HypF
VALSGGTFQNQLLAERVARGLQQAGLEVLTHHRVPPNDGGISLGQAVVANARLFY